MNLYKDNELLEVALLIINVVKNDAEVQQHMAALGWDTEQMQEGNRRLQYAEERCSTRTQLEHERWALSQQINAGLQAIQDQLREHAQTARFAFRHDPALLHSLEIDRIARAPWECVQQAVYFYRQLQERDLSLQAYGVSRKEIQQAATLANQLLRQKENRTRQKGNAEHGTQEKRAALIELREWVTEFRATARVAFRRQPQKLEMFGIRVRSVV